MEIKSIFDELDALILTHFGNLQEVLETEKGNSLLKELLAAENWNELREWYSLPMKMNRLARELKEILEKELGQQI